MKRNAHCRLLRNLFQLLNMNVGLLQAIFFYII